jgi:hypothetical protein
MARKGPVPAKRLMVPRSFGGPVPDFDRRNRGPVPNRSRKTAGQEHCSARVRTVPENAARSSEPQDRDRDRRLPNPVPADW